MKNILFGVSYLGTNYSGWQRQDNSLAIQEVIENAFMDMFGCFIEIYASGRTDAGVHAMEQCFNANVDFENINKLPMALNSRLPEDIRILWAKEVSENFHARYSAHKKTYIYRLKEGSIESPFDSNFTTYIPYKLNYKLMQKACECFVGEHSFKSFCASNTFVPTFVREIYNFKLTKTENLYEFEITGNGFLYNMVRIIVGTVVDVGRGKIIAEDIPKIIESENRQLAGKTMDAKGLILKCVEY